MFFRSRIDGFDARARVAQLVSAALIVSGFTVLPLLGQAAGTGIDQGKYGDQQIFTVDGLSPESLSELFACTAAGENPIVTSTITVARAGVYDPVPPTVTVLRSGMPASASLGGPVSITTTRYLRVFQNSGATNRWGLNLWDGDNELRLTPPPTIILPPSAPSALEVTSTNNREEVSLTWSGSGSSYDVEYWIDPQQTRTLIRGITNQSIVIDGLSEGLQYYFSVYALDDAGRSSEASSSVSISLELAEGDSEEELVDGEEELVGGEGEEPEPGTGEAQTELSTDPWVSAGLTASVGRLAIDLEWDSFDGAIGYELEYWSTDGPRTLLRGISSTSQTVNRLTAGTDYFFAVYALTAGGRFASEDLGPIAPLDLEPIPERDWITEEQATALGLEFDDLDAFSNGGRIFAVGTQGFFHVSTTGVVTFISNIGPLIDELTYRPSPILNNCDAGLTEVFDERALDIYLANDIPNGILDIPPDDTGDPDEVEVAPPTADTGREAALLISSVGNFGVNSRMKPIELLSRGAGEFLYTVDSGDLPAGLSLSASTGILSGSPTAVGEYSFTASVSRVTRSGTDVTYEVEDTKNFTGTVYGSMVLDNLALRFGNGTQNSINTKGLFEQPFYRSASGSYFKLTYSSYPLDMAIGSGTGSSNWTGSVVQDLDRINPISQEIDYRNFTLRAVNGPVARGYGVVEVSTRFSINSQLMEVRHRYTLGVDTKFVKIDTTIINESASTANNVNVWVGTRDDWVGSSDRPSKTRGNILPTGFSPVPNSEVASALRITSFAEGALFYSTTPGTNMSVDSCCSFSNAYNRLPSSSLGTSSFDGSYAAVLPAGDIVAGGSTQITWFYAAGSIAELESVAQAVAAAASPPSPPEMLRSSETVTLRWQQPELQSGQAVTGYVYRYSTNGGLTWTESPVLSLEEVGTPPNHEYVVTGLNNAATYIFQVAAITTPGDPTTQGAWSQSSSSSVLGVPEPPTLTSGRGDDQTLTLEFEAPESEISPVQYLQYCYVGCDFGSNWQSFTRTPPVDFGVPEPYVPESPAIVTTVENGESYPIRIRSVNEFGPSDASNVLTLVTKPTWTTTSLPELTRLSTIANTQLLASSTISSYEVVEGSLPDGLSLSSSGMLTGTPSTGGPYSVTIRVTNDGGFTDRTFTGLVYPSWIPSKTTYNTTTGSLLNETLDTSTSAVQRLVAAGLGATVSVEGLPPGTALDTTNTSVANTVPTITVVGTPTTTGTFRATVTMERVSNPASQVSVPFVFVVTAAPPAPTPPVVDRQSSQATLRWHVPDVDPSQSVIGYLHRYSIDGGETWITSDLIRQGESPVSATISGLDNYTRYIFQVATVSQVQDEEDNLSFGDWSESSIGSILGAPEPPTLTLARGGNESLSLYYIAATSNIADVQWYEYCLNDCSNADSANWIAFTDTLGRNAIPSSPISIRDQVENGREYHLQIRAVNQYGSGNPSGVYPVVTKPVWTTTAFTDMVKRVAYEDQQLVASSSITVYRVVSGSLPSGIELTTSGVIRGEPSAGGPYRVGISAENSGGTTIQFFEGFVLPYWTPDPAIINLTTSSNLDLSFDTSSAVGFDVGSSGATISITRLPPGLTVTVERESEPGQFPAFTLSGRPTASGSYTVTVTMIDSTGQEIVSEILISIRRPRVFVEMIPVPTPTPSSNPSIRPSPNPINPGITAPSISPTPVPEPSTPGGMAPMLIPVLEPTPNVVYSSQNPIPQGLLDILANPLAYNVSQVSGEPLLPQLPAGESMAYENGIPVPVMLTPTANNSGYVMKGSGWEILLEATGPAGSALLLDEKGNIILNADRLVQFGGTGFAPGSLVKVWLFSDPKEITTVAADSAGQFSGSAPIPEEIPVGEHTIQLNGLTKDGQVRSIALGVVVTQDVAVAPAPVDFSLLSNILVSLAALVLGVFLILAWRRRKGRDKELVSPEIRPISDDYVFGTRAQDGQSTPQVPIEVQKAHTQLTSRDKKRKGWFGLKPSQG
jgi:hypothetical protein